jgi:tetratricopeptide (TPR) repeat protein
MRKAALALSIALAPALLAATARISFIRTVRPPHDLRVDDLAVVYAIGDNAKVAAFVDYFVEYAARGGTIHVENAVDNNRHINGFSESALRSLRRAHPAQAYIGVSLFTCAGAERTGEVGDTTVSGDRVRNRVQWLDAVCSAKIDVRKPDGKQIVTFMIHGEGTSPRVPSLDADERDIAYEQATRYAAITAAESIAPRISRETIDLDDRAPSFNDAVSMINSDRLSDARAIWEAAIARNRASAPLHYDLGAVCEAAGDVRAAEEYYKAAVRLAPHDPRYRTELNLFRKRTAVAK